MSFVSSKTFSPLLLVLFLALTHESLGQFESMIPEGLVDFVPEVCMPALQTDLLPCAIENLCLSLLSIEEELAALPAEEDIEDCLDVEEIWCPIAERCLPCKGLADDLLKCIIVEGDEGLSENTTELVSGCSFPCNEIPEEEPETEAPTVSPTKAPVPDSAAPTEAPEESEAEATEAPTASSEMRMMAFSVAIVCGVTSFVLGW